MIKVIDIAYFKFDSSDTKKTEPYYKVSVQEIIRYKGNSTKEIIVNSGHPEFKTFTSCDIGINRSQEWIVFASSLNETPIIYPCGRSKMYRDENGLRDWNYNKGFKEISFLDSAFHGQVKSNNIKKGVLKEYYSNKQLERSEHFKKWLRNGKAEYFYPDGMLYGKGYYYKNKPDNKFIWYYKNGTVMLSEVFDKGIKIDTSILYTQTTKGNFPLLVSIYSKTGRLIYSKTYSGFNNTPYISQEYHFDQTNRKSTMKYYDENGQLSSVETILNGEIEYIEYNKNGIIKKQYRITN